VDPADSVDRHVARWGRRVEAGAHALELSAVLVVAGATVIGLLLLAVTVRLVVKPGIAPFSRAGAITLTCISIISPVLLWARSEGVVTPLVVAAIVANALCLLVGALALVMSRVRTQ
jgi:hypothetical protein